MRGHAFTGGMLVALAGFVGACASSTPERVPAVSIPEPDPPERFQAFVPVSMPPPPPPGCKSAMRVWNATGRPLRIVLEPLRDTRLFALGVVPPGESAVFEGLPSGTWLAVQARDSAGERMVRRPASPLPEGETIDWVLSDGSRWMDPPADTTSTRTSRSVPCLRDKR